MFLAIKFGYLIGRIGRFSRALNTPRHPTVSARASQEGNFKNRTLYPFIFLGYFIYTLNFPSVIVLVAPDVPAATINVPLNVPFISLLLIVAMLMEMTCAPV